MPPLPQVTGARVVRALEPAGFRAVVGGRHQVVLRRVDKDGKLVGPRIPVPMHGSRAVRGRTLLAILDAAGVTVDEFRQLL